MNMHTCPFCGGSWPNELFGPLPNHTVDACRAELRRQRDEAMAALTLAWDWCRSDEDAATRFERIADEFYRATGLLRPGKSAPMEMGGAEHDELRRTTWNAWTALRSAAVTEAMRAALAPRGGKKTEGTP